MKVFKTISFGLLAVVFLSCNENKKTIGNENEAGETLTTTNNLNKEVVLASSIGYLDAQGEFHFASEKVKKEVGAEYEAIVRDLGFTVGFEDFKFIDASDNNGYYMLSASGLDTSGTTVNTARIVTVNTERMVFINYEESTITCSGCRRGCNPGKDSDGDGMCSDCKITNSSCTKTETL